MIKPADLYAWLQGENVTLFAGVPDSLLKNFCAYVADHAPAEAHRITANEGAAVALAAGHHLGTGELGLVYMQNSGLGNAVNPLLSLADPEVYGLPMVMLLGWRGEPGVKDEPQHLKQGRVMLAMLDAMEVPYDILDAEPDTAREQVRRACARARQQRRPIALVARKNTFEPYKAKSGSPAAYAMRREQVIGRLCDALPERGLIVATAGKTSRELFELRERRHEHHGRDFLTVGSMGHCSQIALGLAAAQPGRQVVCLDGDGAALMHLGALATLGSQAPANFKHLLVNNGAHESVGGQPTVGFDVDLVAVARACRYRRADRVDTADDLDAALHSLFAVEGPALLEVRVQTGSRDDLGRPTCSAVQNRDALMAELGADVEPQMNADRRG